MKASHKLLTGLALLAIPLESQAQELLYEITTSYDVASINADIDINADGVNDLIVGNCTYNQISNEGRANAYDGATGAPIWNVGGSGSFGLSISNCSDVNADGVEDLIIGAPGYNSQRGAIFIISGQTETPSGASRERAMEASLEDQSDA
jgi:hypothetical protein